MLLNSKRHIDRRGAEDVIRRSLSVNSKTLTNDKPYND